MERWKDVYGYEGFYQVSDLGRIRSIDRSVDQRNNSQQLKRSKVLSPAIDRIGYLRCALSRNNKLMTFLVHRLVAIAFLPKPIDKDEINHIDGKKLNNHVDNIEWSDRSSNIRHAIRLGLLKYKRGEAHHNSKVSNQDRRDIILLRHLGLTLKAIAKIYPISFSQVSRIAQKTLSE